MKKILILTVLGLTTLGTAHADDALKASAIQAIQKQLSAFNGNTGGFVESLSERKCVEDAVDKGDITATTLAQSELLINWIKAHLGADCLNATIQNEPIVLIKTNDELKAKAIQAIQAKLFEWNGNTGRYLENTSEKKCVEDAVDKGDITSDTLVQPENLRKWIITHLGPECLNATLQNEPIVIGKTNNEETLKAEIEALRAQKRQLRQDIKTLREQRKKTKDKTKKEQLENDIKKNTDKRRDLRDQIKAKKVELKGLGGVVADDPADDEKEQD